MPKKPEKEILSSCCAFGNDGTESVQVLKEECPIGRTVGERTRTKFLSVPDGMDNPELTEVYCRYYSGFHNSMMVPTCPHYEGYKKVKREGRTHYKVLCGALKSESSSVKER